MSETAILLLLFFYCKASSAIWTGGVTKRLLIWSYSLYIMSCICNFNCSVSKGGVFLSFSSTIAPILSYISFYNNYVSTIFAFIPWSKHSSVCIYRAIRPVIHTRGSSFIVFFTISRQSSTWFKNICLKLSRCSILSLLFIRFHTSPMIWISVLYNEPYVLLCAEI
jgi:hypothetical protein